MTAAERIRAWLATQDGPRWPSEIFAALNAPQADGTVDPVARRKMTGAIGDMTRTDALVAIGEKPRKYSLGLTPRVWRHPDEETRLAATRAASRKLGRRRVKHGTQAEWFVIQREQFRLKALAKPAKPEKKRPLTQAERVLARKQYERERSVRRLAERQAERLAAGGKPVFRANRKLREVDCTSVVEHKAPRVVRTSEDFIAAGGVIEVIPLGHVSKPLRFAGHREQNAASWAARCEA